MWMPEAFYFNMPTEITRALNMFLFYLEEDLLYGRPLNGVPILSQGLAQGQTHSGVCGGWGWVRSGHSSQDIHLHKELPTWVAGWRVLNSAWL